MSLTRRQRRNKPKSEVIRNPQFPAWRAPAPTGITMNERQLLDWCLVFMLMHHDPVKESDWWYDYCVRESCKYQTKAYGSYAYVFWWSLRMYGDDNDWLSWRKYLNFKLEQHKLPLNKIEGEDELQEARHG